LIRTTSGLIEGSCSGAPGGRGLTSIRGFLFAESRADVGKDGAALGGGEHGAEGGHAFEVVAVGDDFQEVGVGFREAGFVVTEIGGAAGDAAAVGLVAGDAVETVSFSPAARRAAAEAFVSETSSLAVAEVSPGLWRRVVPPMGRSPLSRALAV